MVTIGINKALFEKRLELNLTRKEVAQKMGISVFKLKLLERGYLKVSKKKQAKFIECYQLDENFFSGNYEYPIVINEKLYEPINTSTLLDKLGASKKARIISSIVAFLFTVMCVVGIVVSPRVRGNVSSYYSQDVLNVQQYVVNNGINGSLVPQESDLSVLLIDRYYYLKKEYEKDDVKQTFYLNFYEKENNLPLSWTTAKYNFSYKSDQYNLKYHSRFLGDNKIRVHLVIKDYFLVINYPLCLITCDISVDPNTLDFSYNFVDVYKSNQGKGNVSLNPGDEEYEKYTNVFKSSYKIFIKDYADVFSVMIPPTVTQLTYKEFGMEMNIGTSKFYGQVNLSLGLSIAGFLGAVLALCVLVFSLLFKNSVEKKTLKFLGEQEEYNNIPQETEPIQENKKELKRNKVIDMVVPEFGVRAVSLVLLFASSIATYMVFANAISINITGIVASLGWKSLVSNLSVLAVMLLYFVKLDIYQNKKSAFATNMFLFALGLLYYFALLIVYYVLAGLNDTLNVLTNTIFSLLPGNIVWAVLVFNLIIMFMFKPVHEKYKDRKHAELKMRLLTLIPFSYLVASCIVSIGLSNGWTMPYAVSSLFFYKAPMITVFAILYCVAVFIYRRYTKKKYGDVNGIIYQSGNKYNLIRNSIAAAIVAGIGIFDLCCYLYWKDNPAGFGTNWLMLFAVPVIVFYHPHIGKRNGLWDTIFLILYGLAYIIGIVLIVFALLSILTKL